MRRTYLTMAAALAAGLATPASADTVCEWMDLAGRLNAAAQAAPGSQPPEQPRASTRAALAMFEALNAIDRRYQSYLGFEPGDTAASPDAAAATAAYKVLVHHYPAQKAALDDSYALAMAGIRDERARESGRAARREGRRRGDRGGRNRPLHPPGALPAAHRAGRMDRSVAAVARAALGRLPPLGDAERRGAPAAAAAGSGQRPLGEGL